MTNEFGTNAKKYPGTYNTQHSKSFNKLYKIEFITNCNNKI